MRCVRRRPVRCGAPPARMLATPCLLADGPPRVPIRVASIAVVRESTGGSGGDRPRQQQHDDHHNQGQDANATPDEEARVVYLLRRHHAELAGAEAHVLVARLLEVVAAAASHVSHDRCALDLARASSSAHSASGTPTNDCTASHHATAADHAARHRLHRTNTPRKTSRPARRTCWGQA